MRGEIGIHILGDDELAPHEHPVAREGAHVGVLARLLRGREVQPFDLALRVHDDVVRLQQRRELIGVRERRHLGVEELRRA